MRSRELGIDLVALGRPEAATGPILGDVDKLRRNEC
jgi:hypothetical protein